MASRIVRLGVGMLMALLAAGSLFASGTVEQVPADEYTGPIGTAKYVFLFVGDGMAITQVNAAETYLAALEGDTPNVRKLDHHRLGLRRDGNG